VIDAAGEPLELAGQTVTPRLSVGRAIAQDGDDAAALLARADEDMYRAKRNHRLTP
jgi:GGDEF domain-containing protein